MQCHFVYSLGLISGNWHTCGEISSGNQRSSQGLPGRDSLNDVRSYTHVEQCMLWALNLGRKHTVFQNR